MVMRYTTLFVVASLLVAGIAHAELKTIGQGAGIKVDTSAFPKEMKDTYPLFEKKCAKCHGLDRTIITLKTGMTPSGTAFDYSSIDAYGAKMLRKPDSEMTKADVKVVMNLLRFMLDE